MNPQQMPPAMYGLPGQFPPNAPYGQNNPQFLAAIQQAQQAASLAGGRGVPAGRNPMQGLPGNMPGMQSGPGMTGFPPNNRQQAGMGGRGNMPGNRNGQMGSFPAQGGRASGSVANMGGSEGSGNSALHAQLQALAGNPQQQKQVIGENIFPKISAMRPDLAGKITGMLLEMDNSELIGLCDDDNALRAKVDEALAVYDEYVKAQSGESNAENKDEEKPEEKA